MRASALALVALLASTGAATAATTCKNTGAFEPWLKQFKTDAGAAGITQRTIDDALGGMTLDQGIINRDRGQRFFAQSFLDFQAKLATAGRLQNAKQKVQQHRAIFDREEKQYGVPPAVIAAFWALESDFGSGMGDLPVLRSLATLAYDCRRGEMFRNELMDALRIIDRGDLRPSDMIGSWAGELGQTQFLPGHYYRHAVDYDGDGRRDLMRSVPDIIASTAAFLVSLGWERDKPWLEEVRVPAQMKWEEADLAVRHPRSQWSKWGVTKADGKPLTDDDQAASLLLLQGRNGPAFLAYPNFQNFIRWNQSLTYATTAAYLATRIAGAPAMNRGRDPGKALSFEQAKELQRQLLKRGYDIGGEPDGKLGAGTRGAVKQAQLKLGLPADSFATLELIDKLGGTRVAETTEPKDTPRKKKRKVE